MAEHLARWGVSRSFCLNLEQVFQGGATAFGIVNKKTAAFPNIKGEVIAG